MITHVKSMSSEVMTGSPEKGEKVKKDKDLSSFLKNFKINYTKKELNEMEDLNKKEEDEEKILTPKVKKISKKKIFMELKDKYKVDSDKLLELAVVFD